MGGNRETGRRIAVNAYYQWNDLGELTPGVSDTGYRAGLAYVDQFNNGKVGIALGVSVASTPGEKSSEICGARMSSDQLVRNRISSVSWETRPSFQVSTKPLVE